MINEQYRMARDLIDKSISMAKSLQEKHSLRFMATATHRLDAFAWVAAHILRLCADPLDFRLAVESAVADIKAEESAQDRLNTVHAVMRTLGVAFN